MSGRPRVIDRASLEFLASLAFSLMAAACSPGSGSSQTAATGTPIAQATFAPTASPTPPLSAHLEDLELIPSADSGEWRAAGLLVSDGAVSYTGIAVQVSLLDAEGKVLTQQVVAPLFPDLLGRAAVPFEASFQGVMGVENVAASPSAYVPSTLERAQVEAEVFRVFTAEDGRTHVLGHLVSSDTTPAWAHGLAVVVRSADGELADVSSDVIWSQGIAPLERLPFLALAGSAPVDFLFEPLVEAARAEEAVPGALAVDDVPRLVVPARGMPFVLGRARNQSGEPQWVRGIVSLMYRGELLTLSEIRSPVPLAAGESLAFSLYDLPGLLLVLRAEPGAASQIEILTRWDWIADPSLTPAPIPLEISIGSFEAVGETLILRGVVRNPTPNPVRSPTAFAAVRSLEGKGIAAGWITPAEMLSGEAESEVVLRLRLAEAIEPIEMEFDVRAFGYSP